MIEEIRGTPYITTGLPNGGRTQFLKEALLQAFGQVDNSGKRKVGQACHP